MHIKHNIESGRTILEMLVVVALVGVLSLFPLEIYDYAITKYRSNILKDEILQRSADLKNQIDNHNQKMDLDKWDPLSKIGVPIDLTWDNIDGHKSIGIQVQHVEKRICHMVLNDLVNVAKIKLNNSFYTKNISDNCKDTNEIIFHFELPTQNTRIKSTNTCPLDTPKGADPDTCQCDSTKRYLQEATNECICWSEVEIDGECAKSCTTSADCKKNEVCENHICVRYEYDTTITEQLYTSDVEQTTDITSTIPETTTPYSTTTITTTTTDPYPKNTSTSLIITTDPYPTEITTSWTTTTNPHSTTTSWTTTTDPHATTPIDPYFTTTMERSTVDYPETTTTIYCPPATPYWDGSKCITCATLNVAKPVWNAATTLCEACPSTTPYWDGSKCTTCANANATKPYWNSTTQTCGACPSSAPHWNGTKCTNPSSCSSMGLYDGLKIIHENAKMWSYKVGERYSSLHIYGVRDGVRQNELTLNGFIYAPTNGTYKFRTHDGCSDSHNQTVTVQIHIDNVLVHEVTQACSAKTVGIYLTAGLHNIHYYMYTLKRSTAYLQLQSSGAFFCSN